MEDALKTYISLGAMSSVSFNDASHAGHSASAAGEIMECGRQRTIGMEYSDKDEVGFRSAAGEKLVPRTWSLTAK